MIRARLSVLAVLLMIVACGGDDGEGSTTTSASLSTTSATDSPVAAFFDALGRTWSADRVDGLSYGVVIEFNGSQNVGSVFATIGYPGLDCAGTLTLTAVEGTMVSAREEISINPDDFCTTGGSVDLDRTGDTMAYQWYYPSGQPSDTATLSPG